MIIIAFLSQTVYSQGVGKNRVHFANQTWVLEDSSAEAVVEEKNGQLNIVSPDGLTLWCFQQLKGQYEISYAIMVVEEDGVYDRLSDMNCFWGAKDPECPNDFFARSHWRNGEFKNYNTLKLFYVGYGGNENKTTRFRGQHGELYAPDTANLKPLLKEYTDEAHLLKPNHWYKIVITATDNITSFSCDGEELFNLKILNGQTDGYFAIRLWKNHVRFKDFKIKWK